MISGNWRNLVQDVATPHITLLDIVESFVTELGEMINSIDVLDFIVLSPVICQVELSLLRACVSPVPGVVDYEWHVSAPLPEQSETLEVSLR